MFYLQTLIIYACYVCVYYNYVIRVNYVICIHNIQFHMILFQMYQKHCYSILLTTDFMIYFAWSPFTGLVNQSLEMLI